MKRGYRIAECHRIEHEFMNKHGSRASRWELVWDSKNKKMVYCNLDTLQMVRKHTAICEQCDTVFVYHALQCAECEAFRSARNAKYYHKFLTRDPYEDNDDANFYSNKGHDWVPPPV